MLIDNFVLSNLVVDGEWSSWENWVPCTKHCGSGTRDRTRACKPPKNGGKRCVLDVDYQKEHCNTQPCPGISQLFFIHFTIVQLGYTNIQHILLRICLFYLYFRSYLVNMGTMGNMHKTLWFRRKCKSKNMLTSKIRRQKMSNEC